jgi:hypothetical protein
MDINKSAAGATCRWAADDPSPVMALGSKVANLSHIVTEGGFPWHN